MSGFARVSHFGQHLSISVTDNNGDRQASHVRGAAPKMKVLDLGRFDHVFEKTSATVPLPSADQALRARQPKRFFSASAELGERAVGRVLLVGPREAAQDRFRVGRSRRRPSDRDLHAGRE